MTVETTTASALGEGFSDDVSAMRHARDSRERLVEIARASEQQGFPELSTKVGADAQRFQRDEAAETAGIREGLEKATIPIEGNELPVLMGTPREQRSPDDLLEERSIRELERERDGIADRLGRLQERKAQASAVTPPLPTQGLKVRQLGGALMPVFPRSFHRTKARTI